MLSTKLTNTYPFILLMMIFLSLSFSGRASTKEDAERKHYEAITLMSNSRLFERAAGYVESNPDSAIIYFDVLANRYTALMSREEARLCARGLLASADIFYRHFNYNRQMEALLRCRKICEDNDFRDILSDTYRNIGNIYSVHEDFEHAIGFYKEALAYSMADNDSSRNHKTLSNLVGAHIFINDLKSADTYYSQMIRNKVDNPLYRYDVLVDGALLEAKKGNSERALQMLSEASVYISNTGLGATQRGTVNSWLASIHLSSGRPDSALVYLRANENIARENSQDDLLAETLRSLYELHKDLGQREKATVYLEEYLALSDKVFNQKAFNTLKNTQFQWDLDKSDNKIKDLTEERVRQQLHIEQQRSVIWTVISGLVVLVILIMIIYRQKERISSAYTDLYERNRSMLDKEKQLLARIREAQEQLQASKEREKSLIAMSNEDDKTIQDTQTPESNDSSEPFIEASVPVENDTEAVDDSCSGDIPPELKLRLIRDIEAAMERPDLFCNPNFTINTLAEEIGSNTTYVSKVINKTFGMNFRSFLSEYRIKESMLRISDEAVYANYTINAIAASVGFRSQSAFISAFTKFTGMKPSTYQQIARKKKS